MTRRLTHLAAAAALPLALAACPLPQPLTEVARTDGGTVDPPRILADSVTPGDPVVRVQRGCTGGPRFTLTAVIHDDNAFEPVEARWFEDYANDQLNARLLHGDVLDAPQDAAQTARPLPQLPVSFPVGDPATLHVVELVVSNGFYALDDPAAPLLNRSPQPGFETQVYRWVFEYVDAPAGVCGN